MPLQAYGVLKATILDRRVATAREAHYHLLCGVGTARWRVAINAWSDVAPSEVAHAVITGFEHPIVERLESATRACTRPVSRGARTRPRTPTSASRMDAASTTSIRTRATCASSSATTACGRAAG